MHHANVNVHLIQINGGVTINIDVSVKKIMYVKKIMFWIKVNIFVKMEKYLTSSKGKIICNHIIDVKETNLNEKI